MSRFLASYENYVGKITDAPQDFGHAAGLSILSTICLGRRWVDRGRGIHPNLYIMLTADSSADRKSTSVDLAIELLREVDEDRIGPDDFTGEGLVSFMRKRPKSVGGTRSKIVLPLPEFGSFLAATKSYGGTLSPTLCKLYDGTTFERVRSGKKPVKVVNPRVSILGGVAFAMLEQFANHYDWTNGFFARMIWVTPKNRRPRMAVPPKPTKADFDLARAALADVHKIVKLAPGPMAIDPNADALLQTFIATIPDDGDIALIAQRERLINSAMKVAMLYQVDLDPGLPIGTQAMTKAIAFANQAYLAFQFVYSRSSGSERGRLIRKIWRKITEMGTAGIARRDLYRACHLSLDEFNPLMDIMETGGVVMKSLRPTVGVWYTVLDPMQDTD